MSDGRPWYKEPETFIAIAALVVSLSAVVVGLYEASLQRAHDRAEVWPHVELSTYISPAGAKLGVGNTGIGPAIVSSMVVMVDGKPRRNWSDVLTTLLGKTSIRFNSSTIADGALRAGDAKTIVEIPSDELPPGFWTYVARVSVRICYASVFGEHWMLSDDHLGGKSSWVAVRECPPQEEGTDF